MSRRADAWVSVVVGAALSVGGLVLLVGEVATDQDLAQDGTRGPAVVVTIDHHRRSPDDAVVEIVATGSRATVVLDQWGPGPRAGERVVSGPAAADPPSHGAIHGNLRPGTTPRARPRAGPRTG